MSYSYHFRFSFAGTSFYESLIRFVIFLVTYSSFQFSTRVSIFRFDNSVRKGEQSCLRCLGFAVHICTLLFPEVAMKSCFEKQACRFLEVKNSTCNYHVCNIYKNTLCCKYFQGLCLAFKNVFFKNNCHWLLRYIC